MRCAFPPYACYPWAGEVMRWLFTGKGMLTYSSSIVAASVKLFEESATLTCNAPSPPAASRAARSASSRRSRASAPGRRVRCRARYLSEESDRRAIIGGLRLARRMFAARRCRRN
jgi:hypothetical protein